MSLLKAKRHDDIHVEPTDRRGYIYIHMVASNMVIGLCACKIQNSGEVNGAMPMSKASYTFSIKTED